MRDCHVAFKICCDSMIVDTAFRTTLLAINLFYFLVVNPVWSLSSIRFFQDIEVTGNFWFTLGTKCWFLSLGTIQDIFVSLFYCDSYLQMCYKLCRKISKNHIQIFCHAISKIINVQRCIFEQSMNSSLSQQRLIFGKYMTYTLNQNFSILNKQQIFITTCSRQTNWNMIMKSCERDNTNFPW